MQCFFSPCLVFFCMFFIISNALGAEELSVGGTSGAKKPVVVDADDVEYLDEEHRIIGKNHVKVNYENVVLTADGIDVAMASKDAVATGAVSLCYEDIRVQGDELHYNFESQQGYMLGKPGAPDTALPRESVTVTSKGATITTDRVDFDFRSRQAFAAGSVALCQGTTVLTGNNLSYSFITQKGALSDLVLQAPPWWGKAQQAVKVNENKINLQRGSVTTCDRGTPHYRMQAKRIVYYPDDKIVAKNMVLFVGNMPVMYFPYWSQSLQDGRANFSASVGKKKEWGWFGLTSWRYYCNEHLKGKIHLDYRELKGFASGIDADYDTVQYGQGQVKTYYMNERDKYYSDEQDKINKDVQEEERYRTQVKHRWQADPSTLALFEFNKLSDVDFIKDYLYREYEQDVQPVSEASLTHYAAGYNAGIYARKRTNNFYSEVERLPEVTLNTISSEIGDTDVYYRTSMAAANLNKKTAGSDLDTDVNRLDTYNELKYPTRLPDGLDWISIVPYMGTRQTYYSKDADGEEENLIRGIQYYGFDMNTKLYRMSDYQGRLLGVEINRMRHVITPSVKYTYIHAPTVSAEKLGDFDEIDAIAKTNVFTLGVENNFQTKWRQSPAEEMESIDLIYFYPHVDYVHRVDPGQRHFSFITNELNIRPSRWMHVDSETIYDQYQRRFDSANIDCYVNGGDKWTVGLGKRYDRDVSEQTTADLYYKINDVWQVRTYGRYLSYTDTFQEQQYTVYRDLHCWLLEMTYDVKLNDDGSTQDRTFWFIFRLKAFPDETPVQFNVGYETTRRI
ncbi:MAG: hypothetical protein PHO30_03115 [Candidatus Omnitrophica bacterium]|nr:hypothetical protein [Candidatus Omnitrophota bacterium]